MSIMEKLFASVVAEYAPSILKGALADRLSNVTVKEAVEWVNSDYSLLDRLPEKYRRELSSMKLGKLEWLNADWCISAIKDKKPDLASLFLSWETGHAWLDVQCSIIKKTLSAKKT